MQRFPTTLFGADGKPLGGATVTVKLGGTGTNASLYADDGITTKANPFTNDSDGSLEFYARNGVYDIVFTMAGKTFTDDNSKGIGLYDPRDDANSPAFRCDFFSADDRVATQLIADGHHFLTAGGTASVTGDTTYRNGWVDVIESGGTAGALTLANTADALQLLFVPSSTDMMVFEARLEKIGDAVAGTRRVGLGSAAMSAGDPTNGIYVRQIDANNAFLICRSGGTETTQDLGFTLNNPRRFRATITTTSVRGFIENDSGVLTAVTAITTNIPTAIMGLSAGGGATASAAGIRIDYLNVIPLVRV